MFAFKLEMLSDMFCHFAIKNAKIYDSRKKKAILNKMIDKIHLIFGIKSKKISICFINEQIFNII